MAYRKWCRGPMVTRGNLRTGALDNEPVREELVINLSWLDLLFLMTIIMLLWFVEYMETSGRKELFHSWRSA